MSVILHSIATVFSICKLIRYYITYKGDGSMLINFKMAETFGETSGGKCT